MNDVTDTAVPVEAAPSASTNNKGVQDRWTARLGGQFCPVSSYFLRNYHRLSPHDGASGLTSTEVMVIIHIMDHKWDKRAPWPTVGTIAKRMDMKERTVRATIKRLEDLGYVKREAAQHSGPNRYHLDGLFQKLEAMMDADVATQDAAAAATSPGVAA